MLLSILTLLLVPACVAQVSLKSVSPTSGSFGGNTILYLTGVNMPDPSGGYNITIGNSPCILDGHYSSSAVIACRTGPHAASGALPVIVTVQNGLVIPCSGACSFVYTVSSRSFVMFKRVSGALVILGCAGWSDAVSAQRPPSCYYRSLQIHSYTSTCIQQQS
jgi:hypothetical protein